MRRIGPDQFQRRIPRSGSPEPPARRRVTVVLPLLMLLSIALLVLSRIGHSTIATMRTEVEGLVAPVMRTAIVPFEPLILAKKQISAGLSRIDEIERLKAENAQLRQWQWKARVLEERLAEVSIHARVVSQQSLLYVTVRTIAQATGPFAHSVLVDAGTHHGLKVGQPVINAYGPVGRVIATGNDVARVLLLTDFTSRIPVSVGPARVGAIMVGTNTKEPTLAFVPTDAKIESGQVVTTSGAGGGLPGGMRLGTVVTTKGRIGIRLDAHLGDMQYLSVLFHDNPARRLENAETATDKDRLITSRANGMRQPGARR
ncbi:MAG: hypothetical protein RLZ98_1715 [Pseudomonadota bacterium]|jgi:rod shape-determining protein MreC